MKKLRKDGISFYFLESKDDLQRLPKQREICSSFAEFGKMREKIRRGLSKMMYKVRGRK